MRASLLRKLDAELSAYIESFTVDMGRRERSRAMVRGLLLAGEQRSIEPMAARLVDDAAEIEAMWQRLQGCVVIGSWEDDDFRTRLARKLDAELPGVETFVIDHTGFPRKGTHAVGVQRQYPGTLGRQSPALAA